MSAGILVPPPPKPRPGRIGLERGARPPAAPGAAGALVIMGPLPRVGGSSFRLFSQLGHCLSYQIGYSVVTGLGHVDLVFPHCISYGTQSGPGAHHADIPQPLAEAEVLHELSAVNDSSLQVEPVIWLPHVADMVRIRTAALQQVSWNWRHHNLPPAACHLQERFGVTEDVVLELLGGEHQFAATWYSPDNNLLQMGTSPPSSVLAR